MILYAESSAVLAWLLGEPRGERCREALTGARRVVTSALTGVECARAIERATAEGRYSPTERLALLHLLEAAEVRWEVHDLTEGVAQRARARFPSEPVRTLDAIHLATLSRFHEALGALTLLSLDDRIRANSRALGIAIAP